MRIKRGDYVLVSGSYDLFGLNNEVCIVRFTPRCKVMPSINNSCKSYEFSSCYYHVVSLNNRHTGAFNKEELKKLTNDEVIVELL